MLTIFGVQISTYHSLMVAMHTGIAVIAFLALMLREVVVRGNHASERKELVRRESDIIAYVLAIGAVVFIILSAITGYLIEPYSVLSTTPILLNKSIVALGALYFWAVYVFIRYWHGPQLWNKKGLYLLAFVTAVLAFIFTSVAGSLGGELSPFGESVLDPLYHALGISVRSLTITQTDVYITAVAMIGVVVTAGVLSMRWRIDE